MVAKGEEGGRVNWATGSGPISKQNYNSKIHMLK